MFRRCRVAETERKSEQKCRRPLRTAGPRPARFRGRGVLHSAHLCYRQTSQTTPGWRDGFQAVWAARSQAGTMGRLLARLLAFHLHGADAAIFKNVRKDIEFDEQRKPVARVGESTAVTGIGVRKHDDIDSGASEHHWKATIEMSHASL